MNWTEEIHIAPSLLAADFSSLACEVKNVEESGADSLHLDIMDGHFVPNISFGPAVIKALRAHTDLFYDVHLMLTYPDKYIDAFIDAGAQNITIHIESDIDVAKTIEDIKSKGSKAGITLNPDTPVEQIMPFLEMVDMALVMTVFPGFGGQKFMDSCMGKVEAIREKMGPDFPIQVDGGIALDTIGIAASAGANVMVAGTSVFGQKNRADAIKALKEAGQAALIN